MQDCRCEFCAFLPKQIMELILTKSKLSYFLLTHCSRQIRSIIKRVPLLGSRVICKFVIKEVGKSRVPLLGSRVIRKFVIKEVGKSRVPLLGSGVIRKFVIKEVGKKLSWGKNLRNKLPYLKRKRFTMEMILPKMCTNT